MRNTFFRKYGTAIITLILTGLGSFGLYLGSDRLFAIQNIELGGDLTQVMVDEEKIPNNLLFFPTAKVKEELLRDNPLLSTLELKKKFPHTLVIVAMRRTPIAKIALGTLIGLIDKDGYIVGLDDGTGSLPLISIDPTGARVGQKIEDSATRAALWLITTIPTDFVIEKITRYDRLSIIANLPQTSIIIAQEINPLMLSTTLQTIISAFRIKGTMPTRIDLRFDKPIVEF